MQRKNEFIYLATFNAGVKKMEIRQRPVEEAGQKINKNAQGIIPFIAF